MSTLSIKQIKQILEANGTKYDDCIEKKDFIRKLNEVRSKAKQKPKPSPRRPASSSSGGRSSSSRGASTPRSGGKSSGIDNKADADLIIKRILSDKTNFYEVMGLPKTCTEKEIKKAYKKLALKLHPDKCKHPKAEEAFKIIAEAVAVLQDDEKRRDYDMFGADEGGMRRGGGGGFRGQQVDPDEIFRAFFGGQGMRGGMGGGFGGPGFRFHSMGGGAGPQFFFNGFPQQRQRRSSESEEEDTRRGGGRRGGGNDLMSQLRPILPLLMIFGVVFLGPLISLVLQKFFFLVPLMYVVPSHSRGYIVLLAIILTLFAG